jgi:hypothetical protein
MSVQVVDRIAGDPLNVAFVANSAPIQKLDKGYQCLAFADFRITGVATHAGYTTPPTKLVESIENLLATLNISATGKGGAAGHRNNQGLQRCVLLPHDSLHGERRAPADRHRN